MAQSEKHKAQVEAWQKENIKRITVKLNKKTQDHIIRHLETKDSVQGYIIGLIEDDMSR